MTFGGAEVGEFERGSPGKRPLADTWSREHGGGGDHVFFIVMAGTNMLMSRPCCHGDPGGHAHHPVSRMII